MVYRFALIVCCSLWAAMPATASAKNLYHAALQSVTAEELADHVNVLADDVYEGRLVGSRGGHAAGQYIVKQLRQYDVTPAGDDGGYFQTFDNGGRNILVLLPGKDPELQHEVVVVGAHYDHVGNGSKGHILGPRGKIYNGADDNASGVAVLLEAIEALTQTPVDTRRSILFAFWDGEEMGMLGSRHWLEEPTVSHERLRLAINVDMVGRLREGKLQVLGTRTGYGLRQLFSGPVEEPMWLDFSWELMPNGDHWSFLEHKIPVAMLHTGVHPDYHRPTDDAERINPDGMREVGQYLLNALVEVANADELPKFRSAGMRETLAQQRRRQQSLPSVSLDRWPSRLPPPRLGITWRTDEAEPGAVFVVQVVGGTPAAAAGLKVHDRIYALDGRPFADKDEFRTRIHDWLDSGTADLTMLVESRGHLRTVHVIPPPADVKDRMHD
jgi:hypothetical protein